MDIAIYTLTSPLHDEASVNSTSQTFIGEIEANLGCSLAIKGKDFSGYGSHDLDIIYVRTGGTEGLFKEVFPRIEGPVRLLTSGKSNSLAASMEILSYLRQQGRKGEIIHGQPRYIAERISILAKVSSARKALDGLNLGIIGQPSDWLISSNADKEAVKSKLGINLKEIDIEELVNEIKNSEAAPTDDRTLSLCASVPEGIRKYMDGALAIYSALKNLIRRHQLSGLTLRCFDLLTAVSNTGCLALALLNEEGIPAGCEGDVPALLSMTIGNALTGQCGFQANPSHIDPQTGEFLFAHCTVPFNMVERYSFNTHFESGIGIAIHGELPAGDATVFKVSGDLSRAFCTSGQLIDTQYESHLCRTQIIMNLENCADYFLTDPIGNHHIVFSGNHRPLFEAFLQTI